MAVDTAIILAGGLGTRLRDTVPDLPKPMAPISGRPFLEHQIRYWTEQGITRFILSVGYLHEVITNHFGNSFMGAAIEYVVEHTPLGTGGGLLLAVDKIGYDNPFLLLNGDTYFAVDLLTLDNFARNKDADWCFSLFTPDEENRYMGMEVSSAGKITALKSGKGNHGRWANGGVYWVNPRTLVSNEYSSGDKVSLEDDIFPNAMSSNKRIFGIHFPGTFIDIGVPVDYHRASTLLVN